MVPKNRDTFAQGRKLRRASLYSCLAFFGGAKNHSFWDALSPAVLEAVGCTRSGPRPADHSHAETALWAASLEGLRFRRFPSKTVVSEGLLPRGPRGRLSMRMVRWPEARPRGARAIWNRPVGERSFSPSLSFPFSSSSFFLLICKGESSGRSFAKDWKTLAAPGAAIWDVARRGR